MLGQLAWIGTGKCSQSHYIAQTIMMVFIVVAGAGYVLILFRLLKDSKTPSFGKRLLNCILFSITFAVVAFFFLMIIGLSAACAG